MKFDTFYDLPQAFPPESHIHCLQRQGTCQVHPRITPMNRSRNVQTYLQLRNNVHKLINMRTHLPITHTSQSVLDIVSNISGRETSSEISFHTHLSPPNSRENQNASCSKCAAFSLAVTCPLSCMQ